jgi:uncharacterized protein YndB with AHSA1/START domain
MNESLKIAPLGEREIVMTRVFDAPRNAVFEAFTKPELIKRWLLGPPGWSMVVCDVDLRIGGGYRYVWRHTNGDEMGMRGTYRDIVPAERVVHTELFDQAWYPGEALITTVFAEQNSKTTITTTILYESRETRDAVLKSPMERGVAHSYNLLAELLASSGKAAGKA